MKNLHEPNSMDDLSKPVGRKERKTIVKTTYLWFALIGILLCIPVFNFILVPIVAVVGLGVYIIYITSKYSKHVDDEVHPPEESSRDDLPGLRNQYQMERAARKNRESDAG